MHWVDRGPAPTGLDQVRETLTPGWIAHYRDQAGDRPSDDRWRDFLPDLCSRFHGICGYCEEGTDGGVDHFKPKSKFPDLVYAWSNWIFACNRCNSAKDDKWPPGGYVDPCACSTQERPERFFDFNLRTGMIVPKSGLTQEQRRKATQTIQGLGLNNSGHILNRLGQIEFVKELLSYFDGTPDPDLEKLAMRLAQPQSARSSVTRAVLAESDYPVEAD